MKYYNTRQQMDGTGPFGFTCRHIARGKSAGKYLVEYGLAQREGTACRTRLIRARVSEEEARRFCETNRIQFPEPPAPKPLAPHFAGLLRLLVVEQWFLPYAVLIRRPNYICKQLHAQGILEQRWRGGITPTSEQMLSRGWDVADFYEYRLTTATVLALDSMEVSQGTQTGWARALQSAEHFYRNGTRLCGPEKAPPLSRFQVAPSRQACPICHKLLAAEMTPPSA